MPQIYDRPIRVLIREMVTDLNIQPGTIFTKRDALNWFHQNYPLIKDGAIIAHLTRFSTNAYGRIWYGTKPEDDLFYKIDKSQYRLYVAGNDPQPIYPSSGDLGEETPEEDEGLDEGEIAEGSLSPQAGPSEFAYEKDLQNFLSKNMHLIEPNLQLYEDEGITGVEFPAGGRRHIDLLAVDGANNYVAIELKVSKSYDRVVGQLLRYMSWIRKYQADEGQGVRGIIIGRKISKDLMLACSELPSVSLKEYELNVTLKNVEPAGEND